MAVFKLDTVNLPYYNWDATQMAMKNDQLEIYIATDNGTGTIDWSTYSSLTGNRKGYVVELDNLEEGFDSKEGMYTLENIEFKCLNISGFWSDEVFNGTNTKIQVRIFIGSYNTISQIYNYEMIFYGVIISDLYEVEDKLPTTDADYKYVREYSFNAYSYLKELQNKNIDDLYRKLDYDRTINPGDYINGISQLFHYVPSTYSIPTEYFKISTDLKLKKNYFQLKTLLKIIFNMISDITINSVQVISDIVFKTILSDGTVQEVNTGEVWMHFDNNKGKGGSFFSEDKNKDTWSFYNFSNLGELLGNLLNSFGLVWMVKYNVTGFLPNDVNVEIKFIGRQHTAQTITIDNLSESRQEIDSKISRGANITIANVCDYSIGETIEFKETLLYHIHPEYTMACPAWDYAFGSGDDYQGLLNHGLYYYYNSVMTPITRVEVLGTDYYYILNYPYFNFGGHNNSDPTFGQYVWTDVNNEEYICIGQAIANYYANSEDGIFGKSKIKLKQKYLTTKGKLSGVTNYNNLKPCYRFSYNSTNYMITKVSRNLLATSSEVEMVNYG